MRTKELYILHKDISALNKHYSHFLFISKQFMIDSDFNIKDKPDKLTTEIYSNNEYSDQFNVRLETLRSETTETTEFIVKSLFLLSYFHFEIYVRCVYDFARKIINIPELDNKSSILTQMISNLKLVENKKISENQINTLDYFRLRRNALVHRDTSRVSQGDLLDCIKNHGKKLNKYWSGTDIKLISLDFSSKGEKLAKFERNEIIECLNIIRRLSSIIDSLVLAEIGEKKMQEYLKIEFLSKYQNSVSDEAILCKFCHFSLMEYGVEYTDVEAKEILGE